MLSVAFLKSCDESLVDVFDKVEPYDYTDPSTSPTIHPKHSIIKIAFKGEL